jgi:integrase
MIAPNRPPPDVHRGPEPPEPLRLERFFETIFRPIRLRTSCAGYVDIFRGAMVWLRRSLEREPTLADLQRDTLQTVLADMAAAGMGLPRIKTVRRCLMQMWAYAYDLGLAAPPDAPPLVHAGVTVPPWQQQTPDSGTLLLFYREAYRPQELVAHSQAEQTLSDATVTRFHDYLGRHVRGDELNEDVLSGFADWLAEKGYKASEVTKRVNVLRRVLRKFAPDRFGPVRAPLPQAEPGTVRHFFETVYRPQELLGATDLTAKDYLRTLRLLRTMFGHDVLVSELSDQLAADFFSQILRKGVQPVTVNGHRARLFALWRLAHERGLVPVAPKVKKLKQHVDEPDAWSYDEAQRIVDAASQLDRPPIAGIPAGRFWKALLLLGWWTALRRRSLLRIRRVDVDLQAGWLHVPPDNVKNRHGKRFRLGPDAIQAIRDIWTPARELLFPMSDSNLQRMGEDFNAILRLAGIPKSRRRSMTQLHKWRRTVATMAAVNSGLPAAVALLGHSGPEITRRYIDPTRLPGNDATAFLPVLAPAPDAAAGQAQNPVRSEPSTPR